VNLTDILKKPIITEKTLNQSVLGKYIFKIDKRATKTEVKRAINHAFGVEAISVRTINVSGKMRKFGKKRKQTRLSNWKKAVVQLAPGQKIDIFTVPGEKEKPSSARAAGGASEDKKEAKKK